MNKIGWCRLLIVISVFYAAIMGMYFGKNYPTDENLKNSIKLNYEAEKKALGKLEFDKKIISCAKEIAERKRGSISLDRLNAADEIYSILSNADILLDKKIQVIRDYFYINGKTKDDFSRIDDCVGELEREKLSVQEAIEGVGIVNFRYELNYPVHKERQKIYIYNSLLVVFLPILVLLFLAKILAWILNGFSKS